MPWKETKVSEERRRFIELYRLGVYPLASLCREFGISRPTAYKYIDKYERFGEEGLKDLPRSPHTHPNTTPEEVVQTVLALRCRYPHRGAPKIKRILERDHPDIRWPAESTIGRILRDNGYIPKRPPARNACVKPTGTLTEAFHPCSVWSADYKGEFMLGCGRLCYPLTITDSYSRMVLCCRGLTSTSIELSMPHWIIALREYGLPDVIRTDNGTPFASVGVGGLTRLSAWWIRLGITPERIDPGSPQQNGRHESMHRTLKAEAATPPKQDIRSQQRAFDSFVDDYNNIRPHEALGMATPASVFMPSKREYPLILPELDYPWHMKVRRVRSDGSIKWRGQMLFVSQSLVGEPIAFDEVDDRHYALYYGLTPLAILDDYTRSFLPPKVAAPIIERIREESRPNAGKV